MQSNGGVSDAAHAARFPVRTLESGPAGGVIGAQSLVQELGLENAICTDVGGTTFDVALIEGQRTLERPSSIINELPILGNTIEIISIGSGGGSVAWLDERGLIRVGPESAGADPGPACFRRGGTQPTVTDAQLVLGWLDPEMFLEARLSLDSDASATAIRSQLSERTCLSLHETAQGILRITTTNMVYAIREITVERGLDPRDFALLSYGGGGGLFAALLAEELEIPSVVIPLSPSTFSAWGILSSDYRSDASLTLLVELTLSHLDSVVATLKRLARRVTQELSCHGFEPDEIELIYTGDLRYVGQEHSVQVPIPLDHAPNHDALLADIRDDFVRQHRQLYGYGPSDRAIELITCRTRGIGRVARPPWPTWPPGAKAEPAGERSAILLGSSDEAQIPVFIRSRIPRGDLLRGPVFIEDGTSTVLVPPEWSAVTGVLGELRLDRSSD
jgi:N-methylhydantoinase A